MLADLALSAAMSAPLTFLAAVHIAHQEAQRTPALPKPLMPLELHRDPAIVRECR